MFWLEAKQEHWWEEETMWEARKRRYGTQVSFSLLLEEASKCRSSAAADLATRLTAADGGQARGHHITSKRKRDHGAFVGIEGAVDLMSSTNEDIRKKAADASKQMLGLLTSVAQRAGASAVGLSTPLSSSSASASSSAPSSSSASTAAAGMDADLGGGDKPSAATNPEDIPKEELLLLCMKMQKVCA